jgi:hypothetical protein
MCNLISTGISDTASPTLATYVELAARKVLGNFITKLKPSSFSSLCLMYIHKSRGSNAFAIRFVLNASYIYIRSQI